MCGKSERVMTPVMPASARANSINHPVNLPVKPAVRVSQTLVEYIQAASAKRGKHLLPILLHDQHRAKPRSWAFVELRPTETLHTLVALYLTDSAVTKVNNHKVGMRED